IPVYLGANVFDRVPRVLSDQTRGISSIAQLKNNAVVLPPDDTFHPVWFNYSVLFSLGPRLYKIEVFLLQNQVQGGRGRRLLFQSHYPKVMDQGRIPKDFSFY